MTAPVSRTGTFEIAPGRSIFGQLTLAGPKTVLELWDKDFFSLSTLQDGHITGTLQDLRKVTLMQCIGSPVPDTTSGSDGARSYFAKLFPHFVVEGQQHIRPHTKVVREFAFVPSSASVVFYDFDAFGSVRDAKPFIEQIVKAGWTGRPVPTGDEPQILYFTGKRLIVETETDFGTVRVEHNPGWPSGGPSGARIKNTISVRVSSEVEVTLEEAITRACRLLNFLDISAGRPQEVQEFGVLVNGPKGDQYLRVHWSYQSRLSSEYFDDNRKPIAAGLPFDPVHRPDEFSAVLADWLRRDVDWRDARLRLLEGFSKGRTYSIDRLVGAANMFDILPANAVPAEAELAQEVKAARDSSIRLFKDLPESHERQQAINDLRRIGKASLRTKLLFRAERLKAGVGYALPRLDMVLKEAVICRNH